jgi:hypothetical protein
MTVKQSGMRCKSMKPAIQCPTVAVTSLFTYCLKPLSASRECQNVYTLSKKQDCFTADFIQHGTIWRANAAFATYDRRKS